MALTQNIRFFWPSTHASIPANWSRDTDFDGYYPYVVESGIDPTTISGGSATHKHSITTAAHNFSASAAGAERSCVVAVASGLATVDHTHAATASNTSTVDSGDAANTPIHIDLIVIKPADASRVGCPDDACAFSDSGAFSGWTVVTAADECLIKIAATAADANLSSSGSNTHTHTGTHGHAAKNSANNTEATTKVTTSSGATGAATHYHSVSLGNFNPGMSTVTVVPLWQKLMLVKNETGAESLPDGVIGMSREDTPDTDWEQIMFTSGYGFIMGEQTLGSVGTIGGNASIHNHTGVAHSVHTATAGLSSTNKGDTTGTLRSAYDHTHSWSKTNATDTIANNSISSYPPYIGVQLWKYVEPPPPAAPMFILPATGDTIIEGPTLPNVTASLMPMSIDAGTPGSIGTISIPSLPTANVGFVRFAVGDVYWRIWCVPSFMRPQNPEREVNIPFTVWMAYPYDNQLTSIGGTGQTGLTLDLSAPRDFFSCEELIVNLQIGASAPVSISALYLFNFTTGQGVFLFETTLLDWLWAVPEEPVVERWEWLSDVIPAWDSTEQRISVRKQPRHSLEFRFIIEDDTARARELHRWYHSLGGTVVIPYYQYATKITVTSNITDTDIYFDPDQTDVRDGEYVVIYRASTETSYLLKLDTVAVDGASLDSPLTVVIERGDYVAPAFSCRIEDRTGPHMTTVSGEIIVTSFAVEPRISFTRPGSSAIIATFDSLNVLERRPLSPVDEIVNANVTVIDNLSGLFNMRTSWLHALISGRRQFEVARGIPQDAFDSLDYWRDFFDATAGPRLSFLLPTWRRDLVLADTPIPGSYQLVVEGTTYTAQYFPYDTFKRMQFEASDGTIIWRKVSDSEDHPGNATLLTLTEALPDDPRWGVDFIISYLNRVRLATDEVMLTHYSLHTTLEIAVVTTDQ